MPRLVQLKLTSQRFIIAQRLTKSILFKFLVVKNSLRIHYEPNVKTFQRLT